MHLSNFLKSAAVVCAALTLGSLAYACPDPSARENVEKITGSDVYYTRQWPVLAGGYNDLAGCHGVSGFVITKPDFSFSIAKVDQYGTLEVTATSEDCDVVLLVNTSRGLWYYNDDYAGYGSGSQVNISAPADGVFDIWVGTYDTDLCNATLELETFDGVFEDGLL